MIVVPSDMPDEVGGLGRMGRCSRSLLSESNETAGVMLVAEETLVSSDCDESTLNRPLAETAAVQVAAPPLDEEQLLIGTTVTWLLRVVGTLLSERTDD